MDITQEWIRDYLVLATNVAINKIPLIFHMIWVGDKPVPDHVSNNFSEWKKLMPHWKSKLWINDDINTSHFSQEVIDKINQAEKGAQKADIMRYHIIEKYGGFYIDSDTTAIRSLDPLLYMGHNLVLYHDNHVTWQYIINSFFGAVPNHPVLKEACRLVMLADLNTPDVNMKTGPYLWGRSVSQIKPQDGEKYLVLTYQLFSKFHDVPDKLGTHTYAASWVS